MTTPLTGITVALFDGSTLIQQTVTDINGEYEFTTVPAGSLTVSAYGEGRAATINSVSVGVTSDGQFTTDLYFRPLGYVAQWTLVDSLTGEVNQEEFGTAVALDNTGNTLVVGAKYADDPVFNVGVTRVYSRAGDDWIQQGSNISGESSGDNSGEGVSINSSGTRIAIGAIGNDDGPGSNSGHVRVYYWTGSDWTQLGADIDGQQSNEQLGGSVSMNAAGDILVAGAVGHNGGAGSNTGVVRVYSYTESWGQLGADLEGDESNALFGTSVDITEAGSRIVCGAHSGSSDFGEAKVYDWNGISWIQAGNTIVGDVVDDYAGDSVAINAAGDRVVVGSPRNDSNGNLSGNVKVYELIGSTWTQMGSNIEGEVGELIGSVVTINSAGDRIATSSYSGNVMRVYDWNGSSWDQVGPDVEPRAGITQFGVDMAMNSVGDIVAGGAPFTSDPGEVMIYEEPVE